jgi:hypothetical protein
VHAIQNAAGRCVDRRICDHFLDCITTCWVDRAVPDSTDEDGWTGGRRALVPQIVRQIASPVSTGKGRISCRNDFVPRRVNVPVCQSTSLIVRRAISPAPQAQVEGTTRNGITAFRPPPGEPEGTQELLNLFRRQCVWQGRQPPMRRRQK